VRKYGVDTTTVHDENNKRRQVWRQRNVEGVKIRGYNERGDKKVKGERGGGGWVGW